MTNHEKGVSTTYGYDDSKNQVPHAFRCTTRGQAVHLERRARSVGRESYAGNSQSPLAWMAGVRKNRPFEPIDKSIIHKDGKRVFGP
jgi:hypothetical protein